MCPGYGEMDHTNVSSVNEADQIEKENRGHNVEIYLSPQPCLPLGVESDQWMTISEPNVSIEPTLARWSEPACLWRHGLSQQVRGSPQWAGRLLSRPETGPRAAVNPTAVPGRYGHKVPCCFSQDV